MFPDEGRLDLSVSGFVALIAPMAAWAHSTGIAADGCDECHSDGQMPAATVTTAPPSPGSRKHGLRVDRDAIEEVLIAASECHCHGRLIWSFNQIVEGHAVSNTNKQSEDGSTVVPEGLAAGSAVPLASAARKTLAKWLAMVAGGDFLDLPSIIAADAVYHSPVEWHPYPGRDLVCLLVRTAAGVLEDFKYHRQFSGGDSAALEFSAHVSDEPFKAVHLLRFNEAGEISDIDLIARPAKGVMALGNGVASKAGPQIKAAFTSA
jgi:hypothetical protein